MKKPKYEIAVIDDEKFTVDISLLSSEVIYFNATVMANRFNKKPIEYLRLDHAKEYIRVVSENSNGGADAPLELINTRKGKYGGTWMHRSLAIDFARWLSVEFAFKLDMWIMQRLEEENLCVIKLLEAKTGYLPMSKAVQEAHETPMFYHYTNEADMINRIVVGMSAKKYKDLHGVEDVRGNMSAQELFSIQELQAINTALIKIGVEYTERKEKLETFHNGKNLLN